MNNISSETKHLMTKAHKPIEGKPEMIEMKGLVTVNSLRGKFTMIIDPTIETGNRTHDWNNGRSDFFEKYREKLHTSKH
jgi:hypothetical protein